MNLDKADYFCIAPYRNRGSVMLDGIFSIEELQAIVNLAIEDAINAQEKEQIATPIPTRIAQAVFTYTRPHQEMKTCHPFT